MERMQLQEIAEAVGCPGEYEGWVEEISTDSRQITPGCLFAAVPGERFDGHDYAAKAVEAGATWVLAQHPCDTGALPEGHLLLVPDVRQALIDIAGAYRSHFSIRCVGITGSVGKTTTKEMVAEVVSTKYRTLKTQGNLNNEIGLPKTLFQLTSAHEAAVIEMGMQNLGEIAALAAAVKPQIGVITNIGVSHLEMLGTRENILKAKLELADALPDGAPLLLCGDNDLLSTVRIPRLRVRLFGIENPACDLWAGEILERDGATRFTLCWEGGSVPVLLPALGRHNVYNALAACAVGRELGIPPEICAQAIAGYAPAGMRQKVVYHGGYTVVEDCYNASPDSMRAALQTLAGWPQAGRRIAVLADMLELGSLEEAAHLEIGALAAQLGIDLVLAYGPAARRYVQGAEREGGSARHFATKAALLEALQGTLQPGDVVWFKGSHSMALEEVLEGLYTA